jgi:Type I phosphodiesterase / nucleotide pyrophosphatase
MASRPDPARGAAAGSGGGSVGADRMARPTLADVLPAVATALGADPGRDGAPRIALPASTRVCLLLVDGLGLDLLAEFGARDAPFLQGLLGEGLELDAGFPSSTPISVCSLATGRPAGEHGIVGFTMHVPPVAAVIECLAWRRYGGGESFLGQLPPEELQPIEPLLGRLGRDGIVSTVVSLAEHVDTGLSRAAYRGARFAPIRRFEDWPARRARLLGALFAGERALVYTYDARLDTAAHAFGIGSPEWLAALRATDQLARAIAGILPPDALLLVTGDHGGRTIQMTERIDLADRADLAAGVAFLSGDPRARHVHAAAGREAAVLAAWRAGLDETWLVLGRDGAISSGLFGPRVREAVRPRIGDVLAVATDRGAIFDRRRFPWELGLAGFHGGLASDEVGVPLVVSRGR